MELHDRIALLRQLASRARDQVSQREASHIAGLNVTTVGMIERKGSGTSASTAHAIAEAFGVSLDWLISGVGERPKADAVRAAFMEARGRLR